MGKMGLWNFFAADRSIRPFLPPTAILTKKTLQSFLYKHKTVYLKPDSGMGGRGINKAWQTDTGYAFVNGEGTRLKFGSLDSLYYQVMKSKERYIVQKAIDVPKLQNRMIDIRLIMMRDKKLQWKYMGMLARVGSKGAIVTNKIKQPIIAEVDDVLPKSLGLTQDQLNALKKEIISLGYNTCNRANRLRRFYWMAGLDLAVDRNSKLWMLEENFANVGYSLFARLKNQTMYNNINRMVSYFRKAQKFKS